MMSEYDIELMELVNHSRDQYRVVLDCEPQAVFSKIQQHCPQIHSTSDIFDVTCGTLLNTDSFEYENLVQEMAIRGVDIGKDRCTFFGDDLTEGVYSLILSKKLWLELRAIPQHSFFFFLDKLVLVFVAFEGDVIVLELQ